MSAGDGPGRDATGNNDAGLESSVAAKELDEALWQLERSALRRLGAWALAIVLLWGALLMLASALMRSGWELPMFAIGSVLLCTFGLKMVLERLRRAVHHRLAALAHSHGVDFEALCVQLRTQRPGLVFLRRLVQNRAAAAASSPATSTRPAREDSAP